VGVLLLSDTAQSVVDAFRQGLRELGYVEGQTIAIEYRWAEGEEERFPGLASALVHLKVDVILRRLQQRFGLQNTRPTRSPS
jgi:putative ABC transport system substrate-binding protein